MNVFERIFGAPNANTTPQAPAAAPIPNPAPNANTPAIPGVDPNNPMVPPGNANPPAQDPFKDFQGIWDIDNSKVTPDTPFFANIDPAKVMESARKTNFSQMSQEQMTAIAAGGPEAVKAMQSILNAAAQNVYGQGAIATSRMVDQALEAQRKRFEASLPGLITKQQVATNLQTDNPIFTNPQLAPLVTGMRDQFIAKFPNATPVEIQKQVETYFNTIGATFAPKPVEVASSNRNPDVDWSKYMGE